MSLLYPPRKRKKETRVNIRTKTGPERAKRGESKLPFEYDALATVGAGGKDQKEP